MKPRGIPPPAVVGYYWLKFAEPESVGDWSDGFKVTQWILGYVSTGKYDDPDTGQRVPYCYFQICGRAGTKTWDAVVAKEGPLLSPTATEAAKHNEAK